MNASSTSTDLASDLVNLFECPVCLDPVMPPIAQCVNGHLLCFPCRNEIDVCPLCRSAISNVRALGMEKVAEKLPYPCNYSDYGCTAKAILRDKQDHKKTCDFRPCACVFTSQDCKWIGLPRDMLAHIREAHKSLTTYSGEKIAFVVNDLHTPWPWCNNVRTVQSCFGHHFVIVLEREQFGSSLIYALHLGTPKEAEEFTYHLEIRGNDRTLTWTCRPNSVLEGFEAAMAPRRNGLVFDCRCFANDKLNVYVTVKRRSATNEKQGEGGSDTSDSDVEYSDAKDIDVGDSDVKDSDVGDSDVMNSDVKDSDVVDSDAVGHDIRTFDDATGKRSSDVRDRRCKQWLIIVFVVVFCSLISTINELYAKVFIS